METHENDPTSPRDTWSEFKEEFDGLGEQLKKTYRKVASENGPSEEDIKDAFGTLAGAWDQIAESVSTAFNDPAVRERLKAAAGSFTSAVGDTISDLAAELEDDDETAESPEDE